MSQKSSVPQVAKSVSQVLTPDKPKGKLPDADTFVDDGEDE